jgi:tetratricopeptide (TPR) repeat protein
MGSYNLIVTRVLFSLAIALFLLVPMGARGEMQKAAAPAAPATPQAQSPPDEANPPEEDESLAPKKYVFNPLESERNIKVGNYYWHKGSFRAALQRYEEATRYDPNSAEAFFKVGEAQEKLKHKDAAKLAFERVLRIAPDSKLGQDAKKKLSNKS